MANRPLSVTEAAKRLPFVSQARLYKWIKNGTVNVEVGPNGRMVIRESEVQRLLDWYEGTDG